MASSFCIPSLFDRRSLIATFILPGDMALNNRPQPCPLLADGTLDSQVGARICNSLGIMRACLETQKLEQLESRMDEIADRVAHEGQALRARGPAPMKPSAFRIERLLAKVEAEVVPPAPAGAPVRFSS